MGVGCGLMTDLTFPSATHRRHGISTQDARPSSISASQKRENERQAWTSGTHAVNELGPPRPSIAKVLAKTVVR